MQHKGSFWLTICCCCRVVFIDLALSLWQHFMFKQKFDTFFVFVCTQLHITEDSRKITKGEREREREKQSLINSHEEDHPSCHCYTIGAPAPATAPTQLSCLFLCERERDWHTVTCDTTENTGQADTWPVSWLYSECASVCELCLCVYSDFHHPLVSIAAEFNSNTEVLWRLKRKKRQQLGAQASFFFFCNRLVSPN